MKPVSIIGDSLIWGCVSLDLDGVARSMNRCTVLWRACGIIVKSKVLVVLAIIRARGRAMPDSGQPLRVDTDDLRRSADFMDMHAEDLRREHAAADTSIADSAAEWVGASAAALQAKIAEWQAVTAHATGEFAYHNAAFKKVAAAFETMDDDSAASLMRTRNQISDL